MGILDLLRPQPKEEKRILKPLDEGLKERLDSYIDQNYGTPYITQDEKEKAAEKVRSEGPRKQKDRTKSTAKDVKDAGNTAAEVNKEKPQPVSDTSVRYSLPSDDDITSLTRQADDYFVNTFKRVPASFLPPNTKVVPDMFEHRKANDYFASPKMLTFTDYLLDYINKSGLDNVEIYKRANLSKSVFSALLSKGHIPKKGTIVALAVALRLNLKETERLLMKAGYTFSNGIKGDLIAVYFINHGIFDIDKLNCALYEHGEPTLGSKSY